MFSRSTDGNGAWASDGCEFVRFSENGEIICTCNHLTNFAVLMSTSKTVSLQNVLNVLKFS